MSRRWVSRLGGAWVLACAAGLTGCTSLPLGGIQVGRGRPLGSHGLVLTGSFGRLPELAGTLPAVHDRWGALANPIPSRGSGLSTARMLSVGATVGIHERVDLGLSLARGLHALVRIAGDDRWAFSLSPAVFRQSSSDTGWGSSDPESETRARVSNVNLTALLALDPWPGGTRVGDLYVGAGLSRYHGTLRVPGGGAAHRATVPTALLGMSVGEIHAGRRNDDERVLTTSVEAVGTWLRQRNGRRDFVPAVRVFLSVGRRRGAQR